MIHAPGTNNTPATTPAGIDLSGLAPTTGPNWCNAPRTAVLRNASTPRCTAARTWSALGEITAVGAVIMTAVPNLMRPTPAAAMKPSGSHAGGTFIVGSIANAERGGFVCNASRVSAGTSGSAVAVAADFDPCSVTAAVGPAVVDAATGVIDAAAVVDPTGLPGPTGVPGAAGALRGAHL